ncbi:AAA family ATPase [Deinococcus roseus]|uniref:Transcriptional regulator NadR n=1 Tax=Deinococcus roseus TaxID=392414 RepID=A0ABQ2D102_9DEIO|nr:AAA family ATPase [Deinococcus roseus]GGJ40276.1 transcriptional regulator NadR [Deinococcus roseus]
MKPYKNSLIVGKFAPLHKGHQLLIDTALAQSEQVYIFAYSNPEILGCEPEKCHRWLTTLYPQCKVFVITPEFLRFHFSHLGRFELPLNAEEAGVHRRFCAFLWEHLAQKPLDAVFTSEDYGEGFVEELNRYFALHQPQPEVKHVLVDLQRLQVPISGTQVRADPHAHRDFLAPEVYRDFVQRVCFLGGESTGKSTLSSRMAAELHTLVVPEYGRTLWEEQQGHLGFEDMLKIAKFHVQQEEKRAGQANRFLFSDTSPLTTWMYSHFYFGQADPELSALRHRPYDFTFLCAPDFPFVQDGTRAGEAFRWKQHHWYMELLQQLAIPYTLLTGTLEERIQKVVEVLV